LKKEKLKSEKYFSLRCKWVQKGENGFGQNTRLFSFETIQIRFIFKKLMFYFSPFFHVFFTLFVCFSLFHWIFSPFIFHFSNYPLNIMVGKDEEYFKLDKSFFQA